MTVMSHAHHTAPHLSSSPGSVVTISLSCLCTCSYEQVQHLGQHLAAFTSTPLSASSWTSANIYHPFFFFWSGTVSATQFSAEGYLDTGVAATGILKSASFRMGEGDVVLRLRGEGVISLCPAFSDNLLRTQTACVDKTISLPYFATVTFTEAELLPYRSTFAGRELYFQLQDTSTSFSLVVQSIQYGTGAGGSLGSVATLRCNPDAEPTSPNTTLSCDGHSWNATAAQCIYNNASIGSGTYSDNRTASSGSMCHHLTSSTCPQPPAAPRHGSIYHLYRDPWHPNSCDKGTTVTNAYCLSVSRSVLPVGKVQGRTSLIQVNDANIPSGCSMQRGGDWATYFNSHPNGTNDGRYDLVCKACVCVCVRP